MPPSHRRQASDDAISEDNKPRSDPIADAQSEERLLQAALLEWEREGDSFIMLLPKNGSNIY